MYTVFVAGIPCETFENYFNAKCRADYLYLQGNEIRIEKDGKIIVKYMHIGGVK